MPIHLAAWKYKNFKAIFCLLKYVIIIENIIRHLVKNLVKNVFFQQKLRQKSVMEQPWSMVSIVEDKLSQDYLLMEYRQHVDLITFTLTIQG